MDSNLLQILVCPVCKGPLQHDAQNHELICKADRLAFPVRDGVPVMLEHEARAIVPGTNDANPGTTP
ncbi:MAG: Trm112 family protein [Pusillimonas sp.]